MTTHLSKLKFIILIAPLFLTACVNLKEVSTYSSNSLNAISEYKDLNYSFTRNNREICRLNMMGKVINSDKPAALEYESQDFLGKQADSMVNILYNAIEGYFSALEKISNNNLTNFHFDSLRGKLQKGKLGINDEQIESYEKITTILLRLTTDTYRKKKIKEFIAESNNSIWILLETFNEVMQKNLKTSLKIRKERLEYVTGDLLLSCSFTDTEKIEWISYYYNNMDEMSLIESKINCLSKSIDKIKNGHQLLYDNRDKITIKETKKLIQEYSTSIRNLADEFKNIKY